MRFARLTLAASLTVCAAVLAAASAATPSPGRPNVLVILWDDIGFGQFGCYGGPLATPNVDRLAAQGLRYTDFHAAPVCSPTRAALLTGRNPHSVGMACITEFANGHPNSRGGIRSDAGTVAEYLRAAGYSTMAVGKWHLTPMTELNAGASSEHWPTGRGFDHFFGFTSGETNPWAPEFFLDRARLMEPPRGPDGAPLHSETALTDEAIRMLSEQRAVTPQKPFFLYLAYSAGHAPRHAAPEHLAKWRGRFDRGWDAAREETFARQKALGLVPPDTALPPRNPGVKAWADLTPDERRLYARYYEVFAAFVEHTDAQLGRLLDHLERTGQLENTLVLLASDNGASPEGGPEGMWNEVRLFTTESFDRAADGLGHLEQLGGERTYPTYPTGWTMAGNTPFRRTKGTAHEGGTRVPLIVHWPSRVRDAGRLRPQRHNVIDLLPTMLEAAGAEAPAVFEGRPQPPVHGLSLAYTWDAPAAPSRRETQYTEIYGHRAIYHRGWKAVVFHPPGRPFEQDTWELYDLATDTNETRDLAKERPEKLTELLAVWEQEAQRHGVYPLDDRRGARELLLPAGSPARGTRFDFPVPVAGLHKGSAPDFRGRSWSLQAELGGGARDGVIAAFGGRFAGWSLYLKDGAVRFHYNYAGLEHTAVDAGVLPAGAVRRVGLAFALRADRSAEITITVDGREAARGRVPRTMSNITHETFDLGADLFTPVSPDYASPAALGPELRRVVFEAEPYPKS
jgi:arylsulfatase